MESSQPSEPLRVHCHDELEPQHYCAVCGAYNPDEAGE